ncbi:coenzyme F420 biosynthesis-associated protein [Blastococcus sp. CT_GayMR20]|nr:coenzyme F420 biosynthesis-associated protein [Blastococcus sp. CT_GayMR20]
MVDWNLAGRTARRLMSAGPETTRDEAAAVVRELHEKAAVAVAHVEGLTGLRPAPGGPVPEVAVVDRPGWVDANTSGMAALLNPLVEALTEKQDTRPGPLATAIGSRATGVQAGGLLAFLSSRVLGQYEIFGTGGRLLLVAPNIVATERKLGVDPSDFRLWVCLHEVTHQLQFTAVPWLKAHLESEIAQFVDATDLDADVLRERLQDVLRSLVDAVRGGDQESEGLMALVRDPAQRAVLDRVTAVMSLVEGHAEYVMDGVGEDVVPSVRTLRKRFAQRRKGRGPLDRVLRRLLGLEQKMKQYAEGRVFVGGVIDLVGMEGFNRVWDGPQNLPRIEELTAPAQWVERVLGRPAIPA